MKVLKALGIAFAAILVLVIAAGLLVYVLSERRFERRHEIAAEEAAVPAAEHIGHDLAHATPWRAFQHLNDTEASATWLYLLALPALPRGK